LYSRTGSRRLPASLASSRCNDTEASMKLEGKVVVVTAPRAASDGNMRDISPVSAPVL
jgi:hypothetical protein